MKICTCNTCGNMYEDLNPSHNSIEYKPMPLNELSLLNEDNESYYGCGTCETDGYLTDNINLNAMNKAQKAYAKQFVTV